LFLDEDSELAQVVEVGERVEDLFVVDIQIKMDQYVSLFGGVGKTVGEVFIYESLPPEGLENLRVVFGGRGGMFRQCLQAEIDADLSGQLKASFGHQSQPLISEIRAFTCLPNVLELCDQTAQALKP
jgi:hypothetical protein